MFMPGSKGYDTEQAAVKKTDPSLEHIIWHLNFEI